MSEFYPLVGGGGGWEVLGRIEKNTQKKVLVSMSQKTGKQKNI